MLKDLNILLVITSYYYYNLNIVNKIYSKIENLCYKQLMLACLK